MTTRPLESIGDTVHATAEVVSLPDTKPVTRLEIRVERDDGEVVLEGEARCYTLQPEDRS